MARHRRSTVEVLPSAKRLIGSLRDVGYETAEAVADLIDNSIAASARNVDVTIHFDAAGSWIAIADDGSGMNGTQITEAMKYGADRDYADDDLGKFGLGLKTASMSQCRRLSVASRVSHTIARLEARQLDLDFVEETDSWRVLVLSVAERPHPLVKPLTTHRGTVVLWEDLDRILNYKNPGSEWARNKLLALAERLDVHLGMVFHKFLVGEVPKRAKLKITINGTKVDPWDPFARDEPKTEEMKPREFEVHTASGSGIVRLEPYVLPRQDSFSSDAAHRRASGPNSWNRQQGFYVYRAHRLIQSGGWSWMRTQDEHSKLARVGLLFTPDLDAAFGINVAKMRVLLPPEVKEEIKPTVDRLVKRAQTVYRGKSHTGGGKGAGGTTSGGTGGGKATNGGGAADGGGATTVGAGGRRPSGNAAAGGTAITTTAELPRRALERAAETAREPRALEKIVKALKDDAPEVAQDLGW